MDTADTSKLTGKPWLGILAAAGAGVAIGAVAGAAAKGSGWAGVILLVAGGVLALAAGAGLIALGAARNHSPQVARALTVFAVALLLATVSAFSFTTYRSPGAPGDRPGDLALHIAAPVPPDWVARGTCRPVTDRGLILVFVPPTARDPTYTASLLLRIGTPMVPTRLAINDNTPTALELYSASIEEGGLDTTRIAADGMSGVVRFEATAQSSSWSRRGLPGHLSGTFEWACPES